MDVVIQIAGSILVLVGFALAQFGVLDVRSRRYLVLNTVGSGILAVPVLTASAAGAVCEVPGCPLDFARPLMAGKAYYGLTAIATVAAIAFNFSGIKPFDALFWTAVINGVLAPPLLVLVMLVMHMSMAVRQRFMGMLMHVLLGEMQVEADRH